jgi:hypothetical protein
MPPADSLLAKRRTRRLLLLGRAVASLAADLVTAPDDQREPPLRDCSPLVLVQSEHVIEFGLSFRNPCERVSAPAV